MPTLSWLTRDDDLKTAGRAPYRLLQEDPALGHGDPDTGNLLIQGDNLEALKALLPFYGGRVKCIYIDPPYNTRSAFDEYDDNLEHSRWLSMMWPRLELLWQLLCADGIIAISINDDEGHYLKVICDEIFGRKNFVASFVWNYEGNTDNQSKIINYHEYILVYSKAGELHDLGIVDPNISPDSKIFRDEIRNTIVKNGPKNPVSDILLPVGFPCSVSELNFLQKPGAWPRYDREITASGGKTLTPLVASSGWSSKNILEKFIGANFEPVEDSKGQKTVFEITGSGAIEAVKVRKQSKGHVVSVLRGFGTTNQMRILLNGMGLKFTFPKPVGLIEYLVRMFSSGDDIVLDSFMGSGTTGHAVMSANLRDGGKRCFVGVERSERTVQQVTVPRLKAFAEQLGGLAGGFRFYRLGDAVFGEDGALTPGIAFAALAAHIWFAETGRAPDRAPDGPLLGVREGQAVALLYNGVLGDRRPQGGNVLTRSTLAVIREALERAVPGFEGRLTVYGERSALSPQTLTAEGIEFRQTPYDVKARR